MKYEYKSITFGCTFDSKNTLNEKIQRLLDEYSRFGWKLHTIQLAGHEGFCIVIFERPIEVK